MAIDDLQWANADGVNLLSSIMRPPDAPALLMLLAFRDEEANNPVLQALMEPDALEDRDVRSVSIGPLPDDLALELARKLGGEDSLSRAQEVVVHAKGSPFFIGQMIADARPIPGTVSTLDRFVDLRIADLEPGTRAVLSCIAVAGGPVALEVLAEVVPESSVSTCLDELYQLGMVAMPSGTVAEGPSWIETAHDRIREVVLEGLDPSSRRALHLRLGEVLERRRADPETLADHFLQGGAPQRAAAHTERAAVRAAETLAFARAVDFYRRTLELLSAEDDRERYDRIRRALVEQLINLGHRWEASQQLLELAAEADEDQSSVLRREAAYQCARSGRIDEAISLTSELLEEMGEPVPRSFRAALWMFVRERVRLWFRGLTYQRRPEEELPSDQLACLDTLLTIIDGEQEVIFATALHARALHLALDLGESRRLGVALGHEMVIQAAMGRQHRAHTLYIEGCELASATDDVELDLSIEMGKINIDYVSYRFPQALERLSRFLSRLDDLPSAGWIRSRLIVRHVQACLAVGRWAELRRDLPGWLASARDQGNLHEVASLGAYSATIALRYGEVDAARRHLEAAREVWGRRAIRSPT